MVVWDVEVRRQVALLNANLLTMRSVVVDDEECNIYLPRIIQV